MKWNTLFSDEELHFHEALNKVIETTPAAERYPEDKDILRAFSFCGFDETNVVWIGQDPYHDGKATGLCMGVNGKPIPPTLRILNLALESEYDTGISDYSLESWAKQGVLLLNASLTVAKGKPGSHSKIWRPFVLNLLQKINEKRKDIVWVALGADAQKLLLEIPTIPENNMIKAPHPMVAIYQGDIHKFIDHNIFSRINNRLIELDHAPIYF